MQACLFLLIAAWLLSEGGRTPWALAAAAVAAAWAGTTLPDLDLTLGLGHRSGLTHSVAPIAVACWRRHWRPVAAGLALGIGLHLSADLFPNAMRGFAMIRLPGVGSLGAERSYLWIAVNGTAALAAGVGLLVTSMARGVAAIVLGAVGLAGTAYLFRTDGGWAALALFAVAGWLAVRSRRVRG